MTCQFVPGFKWTARFAEAIGLGDIPVKSITIRSDVDSILSADVVMYIQQADSEKLIELMKTYYLCAVESNPKADRDSS